jgi:hypothetical protein
LADRIGADFLRRHAFDKSSRAACHSSDGVIEFKPIADAAQLTVVDSAGFALQDISALPHWLDAAVELGIGQTIDRLSHNPSPKDLFGLLRPLATAARLGDKPALAPGVVLTTAGARQAR